MMPAMFGPEVMDLGNALVGPSPVQLHVNVATNPNPEIGQRAILTIRTNSTTLSAFLTRSELKPWIDLMQKAYREMSPIATAPADIPPGLQSGPVDLSQLRRPGGNGRHR